jgi:hypothetical protein
MITPQDILKLIGIPVTDQGTFGDNLVMFPISTEKKEASRYGINNTTDGRSGSSR